MSTICCRIAKPSANSWPTAPFPIPSSSRIPSTLSSSSLGMMSPRSIPMLCNVTQATMYIIALDGFVLIPWCRIWNRRFSIPKDCSTRTLVLQRAELNLSSAGEFGLKKGTIRNERHWYPESPRSMSLCWPENKSKWSPHIVKYRYQKYIDMPWWFINFHSAVTAWTIPRVT